MKRFILAAATSCALMASGATAATLNVEIWDVITNGGLGNNPVGQSGSFEIDGPNYLDNSADSVQAAIASRIADATFSITAAALAAGFTGAGLDETGPSIADFFGIAGGGILDNSILGTVARITGIVDVDAPANVTIRSDDGWQLTVGGAAPVLNVGNDGPGTLQAPKNQDVLLAAGQNQLFELLWFEGNIVQAELKLTVEDGIAFVPLPAGMVLMLTALGGFGVMRRRKAA